MTNRPTHIAFVGLLAIAVASGAAQSSSQVSDRLRLASDLTIDVAHGPFDQANGLVVSRSGRFVIIDGDYRLHFYNASGVQLAVAGGKGAGPGEFNNPNRHGVAGPEWWFFDPNLQRLSWFDSLGHYSRSQTIPSATTPTVRYFMRSPRGVTAEGVTTSLASTAGGRQDLIGHRGSDTARSWLIATLPAARQSIPVSATLPGGSVRHSGIPVPFAHNAVWSIATDGNHVAIVTDTTDTKLRGTYSITLLNANGDTVLAHRYPFAGKPIARRSIDSAIESRVRTAIASKLLEQVPVIQGLGRKRMPAVYQPVLEILIGQDSTLWLRGQPTDAGKPWTIYSKRGIELGTLVTPPNVSIKEASLGHVWAFDQDADGFNNIVRYRVIAPKK